MGWGFGAGYRGRAFGVRLAGVDSRFGGRRSRLGNAQAVVALLGDAAGGVFAVGKG